MNGGQKIQVISAVLSVLLLLLTTGCAGGGGGLEDNQTPDAGEDPDVGPHNTTEPDVAAEPDVSDEPDAEEDIVEDPCPVCCAGEVRCAGQNTLETCNDDGDAWVASACGEGEVCEDDACALPPACTPGDSYCFSATQLVTCRPDGSGYVTETCPLETTCLGAECLSGLSSGHPCSDPDECAGGLCRCGDDESCILDHGGYCTNSCETDPCTGNQVCWDPDGVTAGGYPHCLRACDQACSLTGMSCTFVLADEDGEPEWRSGCLPPQIQAVGKRCQTDDDCVNGACRLDYYDDFGICSHRCEEDGCPPGTACASHSNGEFWCSALCSGGVCPLAAEHSDISMNWDVNCGTRLTPSGSSVSVCVN